MWGMSRPVTAVVVITFVELQRNDLQGLCCSIATTHLSKVQPRYYLTKSGEWNRWVLQIYDANTLGLKIITQQKHTMVHWFTVGAEKIIQVHILNFLS